MFLEEGKRIFYGDLGWYGSLSSKGINKLLKDFLTKKRVETWLDLGSGSNSITGNILPPYTKKELSRIIWPNTSVSAEMELLLDYDRITKGTQVYQRVAKSLTLALASLYCRTKFLEKE